jgi:hypothetical protein
MATYTLTTELGAYEKALAAATVDRVRFQRRVESVEITNHGSDVLYVTLDGTNPVDKAGATMMVPAGQTRTVTPRDYVGETKDEVNVRLICDAGSTYSVAQEV